MSIQDQVLATAVKALLSYRSNPSAIARMLRGKRGPRASAPTADRVTVAAVQLEFNLVEGGLQYADMIYGLARQAVERGAQFVTLPEYSWTPLIGMLPGIRDLAARAHGGLDDAANELGGGASLADIFRTVAPAVERAFVASGRGVAQALGIYLMGGTTLSLDAGRLFNTAYLFGPDGQVLGRQRKLHPFLTEREWMACGTELEVISLPFARVAMPVCMDFTYWETTRLAATSGAEILVNPAADEQGDEEFAAARGVRARVQETQTFGILCSIVTDLFGLHWRGPSRIVAPLGFGPRGSTLAVAATSDREEVIVADLDLAALRTWRDEHALEFNAAIASQLSRTFTEHSANARNKRRQVL